MLRSGDCRQVCNELHLAAKSGLHDVPTRCKRQRNSVTFHHYKRHDARWILSDTSSCPTMPRQCENCTQSTFLPFPLFIVSFSLQLSRIPPLLHKINNGVPSRRLSTSIEGFTVQVMLQRIKFAPFGLFEVNLSNMVAVSDTSHWN